MHASRLMVCAINYVIYMACIPASMFIVCAITYIIHIHVFMQA